jgi:hypothetical protein
VRMRTARNGRALPRRTQNTQKTQNWRRSAFEISVLCVIRVVCGEPRSFLVVRIRTPDPRRSA